MCIAKWTKAISTFSAVALGHFLRSSQNISFKQKVIQQYYNMTNEKNYNDTQEVHCIRLFCTLYSKEFVTPIFSIVAFTLFLLLYSIKCTLTKR